MVLFALNSFFLNRMEVISNTILVFNNAISDKHAQLDLLNVELLARRVLDPLKHV